MARFGPDTATCEVFTKREGVLAAVGHDLKLRPERFEIEADATSVRARFDPSSLRVAAAMRAGREDPSAVSERDRRDIERSCAREVLEAHRFPEITFASSEVQRDSVRGTLSLHGRELSGDFAVKRVADPTHSTSTPVASGSSVPVWPMRVPRGNQRWAALTASREVIPAGLSITRSP